MDLLLAAEGGLDRIINDAFTEVSTAVQDVIFYSVTIAGATFPLVVAWLALAAIIFTIYYRFINLRGFAHAIRLVKGEYTRPDEVGEVSHFQALATAVSGTVGLGNIAGVAVGDQPRRPRRDVLDDHRRSAVDDREVRGVRPGREVPPAERRRDRVRRADVLPLPRALRAGHGRLGKFLAAAFAVFCIFGSLGGGNAFQANQAFAQMRSVTGGDDGFLGGSAAGVLFGIVLAICVGVVIIGGIKRIAKVTDNLVPFISVPAAAGRGRTAASSGRPAPPGRRRPPQRRLRRR